MRWMHRGFIGRGNLALPDLHRDAGGEMEIETMIKMIKKVGVLWLPIMVALAFSIAIYSCCNLLNPNSYWCIFKIYKQPDGTYQVWYENMSRDLELKCRTYQEAKRFQISECASLKAFNAKRPTGEREK